MIDNYLKLKEKNLVTFEKEEVVVSQASIALDEEGKESLVPAVKTMIFKSKINIYSPDGEIKEHIINFDKASVEKAIERLTAEMAIYADKVASLQALIVDIDAL